MNLLQYNNKKVQLTDIDGKIWSGMAYYSDADTEESQEDLLTLKVGTEYIGFFESEIKSVEII